MNNYTGLTLLHILCFFNGTVVGLGERELGCGSVAGERYRCESWMCIII